MITEAQQSKDHVAPHIVFIPHDVSRAMKDQLNKEDRDFNQFITEACKSYLQQTEKENKDLSRYLALSEMQLMEFGSPTLSESDETIELKKSITLMKGRK